MVDKHNFQPIDLGQILKVIKVISYNSQKIFKSCIILLYGESTFLEITYEFKIIARLK